MNEFINNMHVLSEYEMEFFKLSKQEYISHTL